MNAPAYRIDGAPAPPGAFYAAACDPRRSVVVEACAGAGKTWMLVSRILRALLDGAEPHQVLAITFTRKAAGEMRQRLDEWLAQYAHPDTSDAQRTQALQDRGLAPSDAARLAPSLGALHARVLDSARAVQVHTFHGWFAQLLAAAPLSVLDRLGLPPRAELVEDNAVLRPELMRRFHRRVDADGALRADYSALVHAWRRSTVQAWLDAAWARSTELDCAIRAGTLEASVPPPPRPWPQLLRSADCTAALATAARWLGTQKGKTAQDAAIALRAALDAVDDAEALDGIAGALLTKAGTLRKNLGTDACIDAAADWVLRLRAARVQQVAHDDHGRMARLARVLLAEYAALKRQQGVADMADLERVALDLLADGDASGWVQERLDQRLRHVLVDEFQDTSPLQWQALHGWLSSYAGAGVAPAVFIVGDPKQSIYRFRRADPRVFAAARRFVVEGMAGTVLECDHTRRNAPEVIAALNAVFGDAAQADGWTPFRAHTTGAQAEGAVLALPGAERGDKVPKAERDGWRDSLTQPRHAPEALLRQAEAAQVADAVGAFVAQGIPPGEVMVLARRRAVLAFVADALAERGLPYAMPEALVLGDVPEAQDLGAVLDVIASPGHDLSLARALKSPLFGATDDDLLALAAAARGRPWRDALAQAASPALARAHALFTRWEAAAAVLPPHDLLDRIVHEGELMARLAAAVPAARRAAALHAVRALLGAALALDGGRYASLYGFVRALKSGRLRAAPAVPVGAVQLLTVHGAKGLEARAVIVVDADPVPRPPDRATLLIDWPVDAAAPHRAAFLRSEAALPPSLQALYDEETAARAREELNGLYVAMTRAREQLVFSRTEPHRRPSERTWWQRVEAQAARWAPPPAVATAEADAMVDEALAVQQRAAPPPRGAADDPEAARLGQAVHRALEWRGRPGAAEAAAVAFEVDATRVRGFVERILASPQTARFFGPARWAGNEVPLADAEGWLRIDRLVRLDDAWWVLDYKLAAQPAELPAYREQMARYVAALRAAQPGEPVRGGFITGRGEFVEFDTN